MNTPKITPRKGQVLVKPDEVESNVTESGLIRPDNEEQEPKAYGTVIASGVEGVDEGKHVIYGAYAGEKLNFSADPKHVDFVLLFDEDVLAFIEV